MDEDAIDKSDRLYFRKVRKAVAMASITVNVADNQLETLQELAQHHGIAVDVLLRAGLEDWISFQKADFADAADYVLTKNTELYRRLA